MSIKTKYVTIDGFGKGMAIPLDVFAKHADDIYVVERGYEDGRDVVRSVEAVDKMVILDPDDMKMAIAQNELSS